MPAAEYDFVKKQKVETDIGQDVDAFAAPEISPEEFAEHMANSVANAIVATKFFEVVEVQAGVGQIHILGRVKKEKEKTFMSQVVRPILGVINSDDCSGFVGKQFLLKDNEVRYAWVVSFASNDLRHASSIVCRSFEQVVPVREVTEAPLLGRGAPQSGGRGTGRKGAAPVG